MLFSLNNKDPLCIFYNKEYKNTCTLKSCSFAGSEHEFIVSGSDDFRIYCWKIPKDFKSHEFYNSLSEYVLISNEREGAPLEDTNLFNYRKRRKIEPNSNLQKLQLSGFLTVPNADCILTGHRSIVNNIIYHPIHPIMCSAGVEKLIKVWSPFPFPNSEPVPQKVERRKPISGTESPAFFRDMDIFTIGLEESSVKESSRTLALFDFFNRYESAHDVDRYGSSDSECDVFVQFMQEFEDEDQGDQEE